MWNAFTLNGNNILKIIYIHIYIYTYIHTHLHTYANLLFSLLINSGENLMSIGDAKVKNKINALLLL